VCESHLSGLHNQETSLTLSQSSAAYSLLTRYRLFLLQFRTLPKGRLSDGVQKHMAGLVLAVGLSSSLTGLHGHENSTRKRQLKAKVAELQKENGQWENI